ncbi:MAG: response regulator, partial [Cyanobacteria bacterium J06553_1]
MRSYSPCNVLLIDDDPTALELVEALLADSKPATDAKAELFRVVHVERLSLGLDALAHSSQLTQPDSTHQTGTHQTGTNQIVLLDLNLPDSQGIATLEKMRLAHPTTPTIVLTGMDDEVVAVQAIESGAQGFLQKDNLDANLLAYALLLALDRQRQLRTSSSDETTEAAIQPDPSSGNAKQNEIESFERLAYSVRPATVTSSLFESGLIKDTVPEIWRGLVDTYIQILELVLEQKMFRVEHSISYRLRALAEQLGFLKAGARDIVELHTLALKKKSETESAIKTKVY